MKNQRVFDETADFRRVLAGFGERSTPQRLAVWRFFTQSACARTMEDVVDALRGQGLGQATIYRVVHLFCRLDLLAGIRDEAGTMRYAPRHAGHCHLVVCRRCGRVADFHDCDLAVAEKLIAAQTGFAVERHFLDFSGLCPACRQPESRKRLEPR